MGFLFFIINFGYFAQLFKIVKSLALTASINLTATIGITATSSIFEPTTARTIDLINPDNTQLTVAIPIGILPSIQEIETKIVSLKANDIMDYFYAEENQTNIGPVYKIEFIKTADRSQITTLLKPLTLTFFYNENDIKGIEERELRVYRWDGSKWKFLSDNRIFTRENKISVDTNHLSLFSVFGPPEEPEKNIWGQKYEPSAIPPTMPTPASEKKIKADINNDGKVNLIDFSIMAYWWKQPLSVFILAQIDLNNDGKLSLADFSILAYWWKK